MRTQSFIRTVLCAATALLLVSAPCPYALAQECDITSDSNEAMAEEASSLEAQLDDDEDTEKIDISRATVTVSNFPYSYMYSEPKPLVELDGKKLVNKEDYEWNLVKGYLDENGEFHHINKYDGHYDQFAYTPGTHTYKIYGRNNYIGIAYAQIVVNYSGIKRHAGANRYETAAQLSNSYILRPKVVLACGNNYPDALAASSLGYCILLTKKDSIPEATRSALYENADYIEEVFVLGDEGVISEQVVQELEDLGFTVTRLAGKNRIETCLAIYNQVKIEVGDVCGPFIIASGYSFPDALAIGPFARECNRPIFYTTKQGRLTEREVELINEYPKYSILVLGGDRVVDMKAIRSQLGEGRKYTRLAGKNRYETSAAIVKWVCEEIDMGAYDPYVVTGKDFPDALVASYPAAYMESPVVLVDEGHLESLEYLAQCEERVGQVHVVGGTAAISDALASQIDAKISANWNRTSTL